MIFSDKYVCKYNIKHNHLVPVSVVDIKMIKKRFYIPDANYPKSLIQIQSCDFSYLKKIKIYK